MTTISDLAEDTGLSIGAISQILNGKGRFAERTRERVLERARDLGYRQNQGARATRTQRFEAVGLLTIEATWKGHLPERILAGVEHRLTRDRYQLLVESVGDRDLVDFAAGPGVLTKRSCDALILNYHLPPPEPVQRAIAASRVPAVWLNLDLADQACVRPDDHQGARIGVEALVGAGRRRLAFLDYHHPDLGPDPRNGIAGPHYSVRARREGFLAACAAAGIEGRIITPPRRMNDREALAFTLSWLRDADYPDGVLAYGDREALLTMRAMWRLGREPGIDGGVMHFSAGDPIAGMPVAAVVLDHAGIGRAAAEAVLDAIAKDTTEVASRVLPCRVQEEPTL